jgi:transcriptional adapter 2-alpha
LLSAEEQDLCSTLRILPKPYLVIKETILNEYTRRGSLRRRQARELIKIDVNKTSRIYDFFLSMGWIRQPNSKEQSTGS